MSRSKQTKGTCAFCGKEVAKGGASRHLASCAKRKDAIAEAEQKKAKDETLYHLRIQDAYSPVFWLDLEMRGNKTLGNLDQYLRDIWLECCGHLSEFSLDGAFGRQIGMSRKISDCFKNTDELTHIYDFGTSSETLVKVVTTREGKPLTSKPIFLMMRNQMPESVCMECGKPASYLCLECIYEHDEPGTLCEEHLEAHPHTDNYGDPMPLLNSPRTGMCGYTGPDEPPY